PADLNVVCLGADRVDFAADFLSHKLKLPARTLGLVNDLMKLGQVSAKSDDLFGNVAAIREDGGLSRQILGFDGHANLLNERLDSLAEPGLQRGDCVWPTLGNIAQVSADFAG